MRGWVHKALRGEAGETPYGQTTRKAVTDVIVSTPQVGEWPLADLSRDAGQPPGALRTTHLWTPPAAPTLSVRLAFKQSFPFETAPNDCSLVCLLPPS